MKPCDIVNAEDLTRCKHCKPDKDEEYVCMLEEGNAETAGGGCLEYCTVNDYEACKLRFL